MIMYRMVDLCSGAGGAAYGYHLTGRFREIVGVDIALQKRYPFIFRQDDALELLDKQLNTFRSWADFVHVSPPCQRYSQAQRIMDYEHPDLIAPMRPLLEAMGIPYVIENVPGAPLKDPITLCGAMFPELRVYRHRLFESNVQLTAPVHPDHRVPQIKMGRPVPEGAFIQPVGNFSGVPYARRAMGISWMTRDELREAIPPAFTEYVGHQIVRHLDR